MSASLDRVDERSDPSSDPIERIMAAGLELEPPERDAFFADALRAAPELADELRARLALLADFGVGPADTPPDGARIPERLGDFRLIERLGAGGMGVVYRAEQVSLGREVAVKLVRPEQLLFEHARQRFRREVEAVARLRHPGIVPVHTVGEEGGIPYFAMELVEGCTLADALRELAGRAPESLSGADLRAVVERRAGSVSPHPRAEHFAGSWVDTCLLLARQVALALEHAHEHGILHRDVKPSNVAIARDGRAMLLDFGLTSPLEGERITRSGSWVGTLQYMSPEQLSGEGHVDPRTDVYSLGVTLYELLALQAPFEGKNALDTQRAILEGRPDPIRARNRRVPVDATLVCTKAMDVEPGRRYPSATAFARDLDNVLAHRPIEARPPTAAHCARRWVQRRPALAAAIALGVLLAVGTPTALYVQSLAHGRELGESLASEQRARQEATELGERRRLLADFLIESFWLSEPEQAEGRVLSARDVLDRGASRIATSLAADPGTRAMLASEIGAAYLALGEYARAQPVLEDGLAALDEIDGESPEERTTLLFRLADSLRYQAQFERAEELYTESHALALASFGPRSWRTGDALARLADVFVAAERFEEGERLLDEAIGILRADPETRPQELAQALATLGSARVTHSRFAPEALVAPLLDAASSELEEARALYERAGSGSDLDLAILFNALGLAAKEIGWMDEARAHYERALEIARRYLGDETEMVATLLVNLAVLLEESGEPLSAIELARRAAAAFAARFEHDPRQALLARSTFAGMLFRAGDLAAAEAEYEELLPLQVKHYGPLHEFIAYSMANLATCRLRAGDLDAAEALFVESRQQYEHIHGAKSPRSSYAWIGCARVLLARGEARAAQIELEELRSAFASSSDSPSGVCQLELARGEVAQALGELEEARAHFEAAVAESRGLILQGPILGEVRLRLGAVLLKLGRREAAATELAQAREALARAVVPHDRRIAELDALLAELGSSALSAGR